MLQTLTRAEKVHVSGAALFAFAMVALAIAGGINNYSAIPFLDMWNSVVAFMNDLDRGNFSVWWAQHNEHRIVLAKLLFWIDERWFDGLSYFLIIANYLIILASWLVFCLFLRKLHPLPEHRAMTVILGLLILGILFSWLQRENIRSAFQSEFFLAHLLPLAALYFSAKYMESSRPIDVLKSISLGILAIGTLANGLLALPMIAFHLLLGRRSLLLVAAVAIISAATFTAYFFDYKSPSHHGSLINTFQLQPVNAVLFILAFLGNPLFFLVGESKEGVSAAVMGGAILSLSTIALVVRAYRQTDPRTPYASGLLIFVGYIYATAVLTAGGRAPFGIESALASRYTTPTIMAWVSVLILGAALWHFKGKPPVVCQLVAGVVAVLFLVFQVGALKANREELFDREIAALALALGIKDEDYILKIFPNARHALIFSRQAIRNGNSIFGQAPYLDLHREMGRPTLRPSPKDCLGTITGVSDIPDSTGIHRIEGQLVATDMKAPAKLIRFIDERNIVSGFALIATPSPFVGPGSQNSEKEMKFKGYINDRFHSGHFNIATETALCNLQTSDALEKLSQ